MWSGFLHYLHSGGFFPDTTPKGKSTVRARGCYWEKIRSRSPDWPRLSSTSEPWHRRKAVAHRVRFQRQRWTTFDARLGITNHPVFLVHFRMHNRWVGRMIERECQLDLRRCRTQLCVQVLPCIAFDTHLCWVPVEDPSRATFTSSVSLFPPAYSSVEQQPLRCWDLLLRFSIPILQVSFPENYLNVCFELFEFSHVQGSV